jgi:hypothetical protein
VGAALVAVGAFAAFLIPRRRPVAQAEQVGAQLETAA